MRGQDGGVDVHWAGESPKACKIDQTAVGLGANLWLFSLGTTAIAGYAAWHFRQHSVPVRRPSPAVHDIEETTRGAFSSNDEYALINKDLDEDDGDSGFSSHHGRSGSVTSYNTSYNTHPDNPIPSTRCSPSILDHKSSASECLVDTVHNN